MGHGHAHGHHHGSAGRQGRALGIALVANAAYTALQAAVGLLVGSVALLADAGHNLSDVLALAVALGAHALAARPARGRHTFGFRRAEVLAALVNALSIVAVAAVIGVEAARRLGDPPEVPGLPLALVAAGGIVVNLGSAWLIHRAAGPAADLNMRASFLHLAGDAAASLGVLVAGLLVLAFGWNVADPLIALGIAALILASARGVLRDSVLVLLESA
ncbi:MAG TPA: cation diffusion facilitator family transporter, partial [Miltoncostaeaceae bacterium]|nr:cation diffusion facilitator family transporter [Miltoncostaeaceae bacterium]